MKKKALNFLIGLLVVALILVINWLAVNILTYMICWCFSLTYSVKIGTGVFLVLFLLDSQVRDRSKGKRLAE